MEHGANELTAHDSLIQRDSSVWFWANPTAIALMEAEKTLPILENTQMS